MRAASIPCACQKSSGPGEGGKAYKGLGLAKESRRVFTYVNSAEKTSVVLSNLASLEGTILWGLCTCFG